METGYRNDPKFSDRQAWANSADPDQTAPRNSLIRVYTVCHSACIVGTHYSIVEPHSSNFRGVRIFRTFTVSSCSCDTECLTYDFQQKLSVSRRIGYEILHM